MSDIKDGGPAFPVQESLISNSTGEVPASSGMSLRDWFAGQALPAIIARGSDCGAIAETKDAYYYADMMLEAREYRR